jgi:hypothetical protein
LPEGLACAVGAKANVPFAGWHKIVFKKCGGKKIKYIGSVSVSVYMLSVCNIVSMSVFTCQNGLLFLFIVVSLLLSGRPLHLLPTFSICKVGDCVLQTYQTVTTLKRAATVEFTTITPILYIHCCAFVLFYQSFILKSLYILRG